MIANLLAAVGIMGSSTALAPEQIHSYVCKVIVISEDLQPSGTFEREITRPALTHQSHGGTPTEIREGDHIINVMADGKWRGLSWIYKGKMRAEALSAHTGTLTENSVFIIYNPENQNEQVALSCDPSTKGVFPTE